MMDYPAMGAVIGSVTAVVVGIVGVVKAKYGRKEFKVRDDCDRRMRNQEKIQNGFSEKIEKHDDMFLKIERNLGQLSTLPEMIKIILEEISIIKRKVLK